jgi:hypothetical protein
MVSTNSQLQHNIGHLQSQTIGPTRRREYTNKSKHTTDEDDPHGTSYQLTKRQLSSIYIELLDLG